MASQEAYYEKLSAKAAESLGLPNGFKAFSPFPFSGMNRQASRIAVADQEFYYLENYIRSGDGNLRTIWGHGSALYTVPVGKTIVYFFWYNIGATSYCAVFLSDGTAVQVEWPSGTQTVISSAVRTFYTGGQLPVCSQWGTLFLLIANNITPNSYWIWDGTNLYGTGSLGPGITITDGGTGYSSLPTITPYGGHGTGVTAVSTLSNGAIVNITITNPGSGYLPGDVVQFAFSGGGSDSSAILQPVLVLNQVSSLELITPGSGYTAGTYALGFSGGGGTGAAGTYVVSSAGVVTTLTVTNSGSGYTGSPTVSFPSGGGTGAVALAILSSGSVASVTVVNGGSGFNSTPTLTFSGGGASTQATGTAVLTGGAISSVTITNGGAGYTSAPAVLVQTAVNNAAAATATLMPYGVSGSSMETFQQRVWLPYPNQTGNQENGGTFLVSGPGSLTDFSPTVGGTTYTSTDPFLRYQYVNIKQSNGYLSPIGDSSVDVISNVQTSGNPTATTFNYQNTDPQVGTSWRDTVNGFSRTIVFGNPLGIYGLYGGSVTKISAKLDDLFTNMVQPQNGGVTPSSALANVFSQKILLMLVTISDPYTGNARNVMVSWDEKEWFVTSQSVSLTYISTQEVNSNITAWGTDGTGLYPLFNTPSSTLNKVFSTKLYGAQAGFVLKQAMGLYVQAQDLSTTRSGVTFSSAAIDTELSSFPVPNTVTFPANTSTIPAFSAIFPTETGDTVGVNLGVTMSSTSPDFALQNLILGYVDVTGLFGSTYLTNFTGE